MLHSSDSSSSRSTLLYAVRHGESIWNIEGRLTGWSDVALTDLGRDQARALRPFLQDHRFDSVWSSPLQRARETAELAWGTTFAQDERLKEFHFGEHEGRTLASFNTDYVQLLRNFESFAPPGGEIGVDFYARVDAFYDGLPSGKHLMFAHGGVIKRLFERAGLRKFPDNACIVVADIPRRTIVKEIPNPLILP